MVSCIFDHSAVVDLDIYACVIQSVLVITVHEMCFQVPPVLLIISKEFKGKKKIKKKGVVFLP